MTDQEFAAVPVGGARIEWDPAVGSFSAYEVQRTDEWTAWRQIARVTDQAADEFYDWEGRLGIESLYRVRAINALGLHSAWSPEVSVIACAPECGYTFTSNEAPELNVGYADSYAGPADRTYTFPEATEVEEHTFYLRDYQVQFRPLERRGMKFTRRLVTTGFVAPARPGPFGGFNAIRDLAAASLSYVCVRDESGNRWFAGIQVPDGTIHQPGHFSFATVNVTEVTDIPSTPDAAT